MRDERNMKTSSLKTGLLCAGLAVVSSSQAAYEGPGLQPAPTSIASILKKPVEDQSVVLQGALLKKLGKKMYLFSDGHDSIKAEVDDKDLRDITVTETTVLEITGEVDTKLFGPPEIEVHSLRIISP